MCIHETAKLPFTIHQNAAASWSSFSINKMKYHLHNCRFALLQESGNTFPLTRIFTCYNTLHVTARKTVKYHILKMVFNPGHRLHCLLQLRIKEVIQIEWKKQKKPSLNRQIFHWPFTFVCLLSVYFLFHFFIIFTL